MGLNRHNLPHTLVFLLCLRVITTVNHQKKTCKKCVLDVSTNGPNDATKIKFFANE